MAYFVDVDLKEFGPSWTPMPDWLRRYLPPKSGMRLEGWSRPIATTSDGYPVRLPADGKIP